ncbi:hypothetical protein Hanom_Chr04g00315201 [Helianthus anomalus]
MNINHISTRLGYWMVRNFDEMFDKLNIGKHQIKITSDTVYEVFGIPKLPKSVVIIVDKNKVKKVEKTEKSKEPKSGESVIDKFISQWGDNARITHGLIATAMENQTDGGSLFRNLFPGAVEDIPHLDWCSYLLDTLRRTRAGWKNTKIQYVGPVAFLMLLYTHEYNKRHQLFEKVVEIPVIRYITSMEIDKVAEHISDNGPMWTNESENENEHGRSTEEYTIRPVDTLIGILQPDDEGLTKTNDGGITDTLIANIQTVEPGVYAYKPHVQRKHFILENKIKEENLIFF